MYFGILFLCLEDIDSSAFIDVLHKLDFFFLKSIFIQPHDHEWDLILSQF